MTTENIKSATDAQTVLVAIRQVLEKMMPEELKNWRVTSIDNKRIVEERSLDVGFPFGRAGDRWAFTGSLHDAKPKSRKEGGDTGFSKTMIAGLNEQADQGKVVRDRPQYQPKPVICNGDGPIAKFRMYYKKYYAKLDSEPRHMQAVS